jgi:hypothetical protein
MAWQDDYVSPLRVVSKHDPALNLEAMDLSLYEKTRDPSLVQELPGCKARWFVLRPLSFKDRCACDTAASPERKFVFAAQFSIERVEMEDNTTMLPKSVIPGRSDRVWGDDDLETLFRSCGMPTIYEMGIIAYARTDWGKGWARGAGSFPQLRA